MGEIVHLDRGVYPAPRASALSGVPLTTIHYWARHDILTPSASPARVRLWTWGDLLALRTIHWLRTSKQEARATSMREVRLTLAKLDEKGLEASDLRRLVAVTKAGSVFLEFASGPESLGGQPALQDVLPLVRPFDTGVDLLNPARGLTILPGKLSGEPHLEGTRLGTAAVFALAQRGFSAAQIAGMYPEVPATGIDAAVLLERRLRLRAS